MYAINPISKSGQIQQLCSKLFFNGPLFLNRYDLLHVSYFFQINHKKKKIRIYSVSARSYKLYVFV